MVSDTSTFRTTQIEWKDSYGKLDGLWIYNDPWNCSKLSETFDFRDDVVALLYAKTLMTDLRMRLYLRGNYGILTIQADENPMPAILKVTRFATTVRLWTLLPQVLVLKTICWDNSTQIASNAFL